MAYFTVSRELVDPDYYDGVVASKREDLQFQTVVGRLKGKQPLDWEQKVQDVKEYHVDTFVMGDDWKGKFDFLSDYCEVVYLERTPEVSTTQIKNDLNKK